MIKKFIPLNYFYFICFNKKIFVIFAPKYNLLMNINNILGNQNPLWGINGLPNVFNPYSYVNMDNIPQGQELTKQFNQAVPQRITSQDVINGLNAFQEPQESLKANINLPQNNLTNNLFSKLGDFSSLFAGNNPISISNVSDKDWVNGVASAMNTGLNIAMPGLGTLKGMADQIGLALNKGLSNGYSSGFGDFMSSYGSIIPGSGIAGQLAAGAYNRVMGSKLNEDFINQTKAQTEAIGNQTFNAVGNNNLLSDWNNMSLMDNVKKSDVGKDASGKILGVKVFNGGHKAADETRKLNANIDAANRNVINKFNNQLDQSNMVQDFNRKSSYFANGGSLNNNVNFFKYGGDALKKWQEGINIAIPFIQREEGWKSTPYLDGKGYNKDGSRWRSVGYGFNDSGFYDLYPQGISKAFEKGMTKQEATKIMGHYLNKAVKQLDSIYGEFNLTPQQKAAILDVYYQSPKSVSKNSEFYKSLKKGDVNAFNKLGVKGFKDRNERRRLLATQNAKPYNGQVLNTDDEYFEAYPGSGTQTILPEDLYPELNLDINNYKEELLPYINEENNSNDESNLNLLNMMPQGTDYNSLPTDQKILQAYNDYSNAFAPISDGITFALGGPIIPLKRNNVERYDRHYNIRNEYENGGELNTHGATFSNGLSYINTGGTHESNPNEGIQIGVDQQGNPNLVEEGEVIANGDYVFSNRLKVPDEFAKKYGLKKGVTFADAIKGLSKESEERPNDPISRNGLQSSLNELTQEQEEVRAKDQEEKFNRMQNLYDQLMIEDMVNQQEQQPVEQPMSEEDLMQDGMYAFGGNLFDKGGSSKGMTVKNNDPNIYWDETGTYQKNKDGKWITLTKKDDFGYYTEQRGGGKRYTTKAAQDAYDAYNKANAELALKVKASIFPSVQQKINDYNQQVNYTGPVFKEVSDYEQQQRDERNKERQLQQAIYNRDAFVGDLIYKGGLYTTGELLDPVTYPLQTLMNWDDASLLDKGLTTASFIPYVNKPVQMYNRGRNAVQNTRKVIQAVNNDVNKINSAYNKGRRTEQVFANNVKNQEAAAAERTILDANSRGIFPIRQEGTPWSEFTTSRGTPFTETLNVPKYGSTELMSKKEAKKLEKELQKQRNAKKGTKAEEPPVNSNNTNSTNNNTNTTNNSNSTNTNTNTNSNTNNNTNTNTANNSNPNTNNNTNVNEQTTGTFSDRARATWERTKLTPDRIRAFVARNKPKNIIGDKKQHANWVKDKDYATARYQSEIKAADKLTSKAEREEAYSKAFDRFSNRMSELRDKYRGKDRWRNYEIAGGIVGTGGTIAGGIYGYNALHTSDAEAIEKGYKKDKTLHGQHIQNVTESKLYEGKPIYTTKDGKTVKVDGFFKHNNGDITWFDEHGNQLKTTNEYGESVSSHGQYLNIKGKNKDIADKELEELGVSLDDAFTKNRMPAKKIEDHMKNREKVAERFKKDGLDDETAEAFLNTYYNEEWMKNHNPNRMDIESTYKRFKNNYINSLIQQGFTKKQAEEQYKQLAQQNQAKEQYEETAQKVVSNNNSSNNNSSNSNVNKEEEPKKKLRGRELAALVMNNWGK